MCISVMSIPVNFIYNFNIFLVFRKASIVINNPAHSYRMVFACMRTVCLFLLARAVVKFLLRAAST